MEEEEKQSSNQEPDQFAVLRDFLLNFKVAHIRVEPFGARQDTRFIYLNKCVNFNIIYVTELGIQFLDRTVHPIDPLEQKDVPLIPIINPVPPDFNPDCKYELLVRNKKIYFMPIVPYKTVRALLTKPVEMNERSVLFFESVSLLSPRPCPTMCTAGSKLLQIKNFQSLQVHGRFQTQLVFGTVLTASVQNAFRHSDIFQIIDVIDKVHGTKLMNTVLYCPSGCGCLEEGEQQTLRDLIIATNQKMATFYKNCAEGFTQNNLIPQYSRKEFNVLLKDLHSLYLAAVFFEAYGMQEEILLMSVNDEKVEIFLSQNTNPITRSQSWRKDFEKNWTDRIKLRGTQKFVKHQVSELTTFDRRPLKKQKAVCYRKTNENENDNFKVTLNMAEFSTLL